MIHWFSNPGLAHAHLDYPTLVPSLHAATYDSLGHVDDFVTKFWPVWMLFFLVTAFASLVRDSKRHFSVPWLAPLALLLLPATQEYVQWEGSTMPMTFFTVLGCMQCCLWMVNQDNNRLVLGLALLFGAAMTTYQGCIVLAFAIGWLLLLPSLRRSLIPFITSRQPWRIVVFFFLPVFLFFFYLFRIPSVINKSTWGIVGLCLLAVLPFIFLRLQIPVVNYESHWADYAVKHPAATVSVWPGIA